MLAQAHEGAHHMGDGLVGVVLVGETPAEDHVRGDPIALREAVDIFVGLGGVHVVDAQVEGGTDFELRQHT
ncbi:hypothetical protein D3C76_1500900 [compost metagenome]